MENAGMIDSTPPLATAPLATPPLVRGDRVRMSALGLARHPKYASHRGVVVGRVSANSLRVKFDERTQIQTIHHSYLVRVVEG
jgi:hypothetical protein